jgi:hypothetical protein
VTHLLLLLLQRQEHQQVQVLHVVLSLSSLVWQNGCAACAWRLASPSAHLVLLLTLLRAWALGCCCQQWPQQRQQQVTPAQRQRQLLLALGCPRVLTWGAAGCQLGLPLPGLQPTGAVLPAKPQRQRSVQLRQALPPLPLLLLLPAVAVWMVQHFVRQQRLQRAPASACAL